MHFAHVILMLYKLDRRLLLPIRRWIPHLDELIARPEEYLAGNEVEIGPWFRLYTFCTGFALFAFLGLMGVTLMLTEWPKPFGLAGALALLGLGPVGAGLLWRPFRGGSCTMDADGVHFCRHSKVLFLPWEVFHAAGNPIYDEERERLYLPLDSSLLNEIELWHGGKLMASGVDASASHAKVLAKGVIVLKICYAAAPLELGECLLSVGRRLNRHAPTYSAMPAAPSRTVQRLNKGWLQVNLPSMVFPGACCSCLRPTTDQRLFGVDSSSMQFWIPHCEKCAWASRWKYWRLLGKYASLFTLATTLVAALIGLVLDLNGWSPPGQNMMMVLLTLCALVLGSFLCCIPAHFLALAASQPVRLSRYDPAAGTVLLRIRNPEYAELFAGDQAAPEFEILDE
jgi:hypothetical protein